MVFELPQLSYGYSDLAPFISEETLQFHHGKHHKTYVDNLNKLIAGTEFEDMMLEEIVASAPEGPIFNNAAQVWNHGFYFEALSLARKELPSGDLAEFIDSKWGSFDDFKKEFTSSALANFGSGWTWLVQEIPSGELSIVNTSNAKTPVTDGNLVPLLTCDVWEHAYYIDYRNRRAEYLENFWKIINWEIVESRFSQ